VIFSNPGFSEGISGRGRTEGVCRGMCSGECREIMSGRKSGCLGVFSGEGVSEVKRRGCRETLVNTHIHTERHGDGS